MNTNLCDGIMRAFDAKDIGAIAQKIFGGYPSPTSLICPLRQDDTNGRQCNQLPRPASFWLQVFPSWNSMCWRICLSHQHLWTHQGDPGLPFHRSFLETHLNWQYLLLMAQLSKYTWGCVWSVWSWRWRCSCSWSEVTGSVWCNSLIFGFCPKSTNKTKSETDAQCNRHRFEIDHHVLVVSFFWVVCPRSLSLCLYSCLWITPSSSGCRATIIKNNKRRQTKKLKWWWYARIAEFGKIIKQITFWSELIEILSKKHNRENMSSNRASRKPNDSSFGQQKLANWSPNLSPLGVAVILVAIGVVFIPVGTTLVQIANNVIIPLLTVLCTFMKSTFALRFTNKV